MPRPPPHRQPSPVARYSQQPQQLLEPDVEPGSVSLTLNLVDEADNGGAAITRYELQIWYNDKWNAADDLEAVETLQVVEGLTPGRLAYFATRAHNSAGAGQWSPLASASASFGPPDTPVLSAAPVDSESIKLTWTVPEDNGSTITSYQLQVFDNTENGDAWIEGSNLLAPVVAVVPPQSKFTTEYTHKGLSGGTEYSFRIRALTAPNAGSDWTTPSEEFEYRRDLCEDA